MNINHQSGITAPRSPRRRAVQGSVLMGALIITSIIALSLLAYLNMSTGESRSVLRSQAWNAALVVAEAGVEEAMTQLNFQEGENLSANGWTLADGSYMKQRNLDTDSYYVTAIDETDLTITSTGYVKHGPENYVSRTLEATVDTANTIFTDAIIAKKHVKFRPKKGGDSYDSGSRGRGKPGNGNGSGSSGSGNGNGNGGPPAGKGGKTGKAGKGTNPNTGASRGYDKNNYRDNFGMAATAAKKNAIKVDKTKVYGSAQVAPKGNVEVKDDASLGSMIWVNSNNEGLDPERFGDSFRFTFPPVELPFTGGAVIPVSETVNGVEYQYVLDTGNYQLGKVELKKPMLIRGDAVLLVTDSFKADKDKDIVFQTTNSTLKLYVAGGHLHLKPKNVVNLDVPAHFQIYGLEKNKCVKIEKDADFSGVIYAPRARIHLKGDGDFYGSAVGKCVHVSGNNGCHFDEALTRLYGDFEQFVILSWREL